MLLAIVVGNSNITLGVFDGDRLRMRAKVSAEAERSADEYLVLLYDLLRVNGVDRERLTGCIMASVVPSLTGLVEEAVTRLTALRVIQVGPGTKTGFRIRIDDPTELGADLAADTAGAIAVYGVPLLIIDAGTVTTIAAVDKSRTYLGGCILPGLYASAALLKSSTALLPAIALRPPGENVLGKNSADAMRYGLLCGSAMMVDGFLERYRALPGMAGAAAIATGGSAALLTASCRSEITVDPELTLRGLRRLYQLNTAKKL